MTDRESNSGPITLPPLLQACVDDGLLDRDVAETVNSFRKSSGVGMLRALGKLGLLSEGAVPGVSGRADEREEYRPLMVNSAEDPDQTFDTFVVCQANAFPVEVARRVAEGRASTTYNPFYIYSDVGLGKTHLLCAIGNAAADSARMVNTADLEVEYERARRLELRAEFRRFLAEPKILAVDDIQLCEGDEGLQRELFSVLNHRIREGKSVVISSDVPPTRLGGVEERLVSRLGGGVILGLQMCDAPGLVEILRRSFGEGSLPPQVVDYLAENANQNIRAAKAAAKQLICLKEETGEPISIDMARAVAPLPEDLAHTNVGIREAAMDPDGTLATMSLAGDKASMFKDMLDAAESEEEQLLALQIALGERLRQLREEGGEIDARKKLERALELLRDGNAEEAIRCMNE